MFVHGRLGELHYFSCLAALSGPVWSCLAMLCKLLFWALHVSEVLFIYHTKDNSNCEPWPKHQKDCLFAVDRVRACDDRMYPNNEETRSSVPKERYSAYKLLVWWSDGAKCLMKSSDSYLFSKQSGWVKAVIISISCCICLRVYVVHIVGHSLTHAFSLLISSSSSFPCALPSRCM